MDSLLDDSGCFAQDMFEEHVHHLGVDDIRTDQVCHLICIPTLLARLFCMPVTV